jgi:hypothetical protein
MYPHWRVSADIVVLGETQVFYRETGLTFIASPPFEMNFGDAKFVARINYVRKITEVSIALLLTFGLMRALKLKKPAGD